MHGIIVIILIYIYIKINIYIYIHFYNLIIVFKIQTIIKYDEFKVLSKVNNVKIDIYTLQVQLHNSLCINCIISKYNHGIELR